jgi:nucleoside-diphosphate-sugar epimerase
MLPNRPKVLILGRGFIGTALASALSTGAADVVVFDRRECDLTEAADTLRKITHCAPDVIVMTAAITRLKGNSLETLLANVAMLQNVLAASGGVRHFIFMSSVDVYGNQPASPLTTRSPLSPFDHYGASKYIGEALAMRTFAHTPTTLTVLRLNGIFGPSDGGLSTISKMVSSCLRDRKIAINGAGETLRDFCAVEDLAQIVRRLIERPVGGGFNVASGHSLSIRQIAGVIRDTLLPEVELLHRDSGGGREYSLVFDQTDFYVAVPSFVFTPLKTALLSYKPS